MMDENIFDAIVILNERGEYQKHDLGHNVEMEYENIVSSRCRLSIWWNNIELVHCLFVFIWQCLYVSLCVVYVLLILCLHDSVHCSSVLVFIWQCSSVFVFIWQCSSASQMRGFLSSLIVMHGATEELEGRTKQSKNLTTHQNAAPAGLSIKRTCGQRMRKTE